MALASSGSISIGGTTANRSINLELGRSATATSSLGEATLRALANDTSGAISMSTFRGKSNALETQTVTVGYSAGGQYTPTKYGTGYTGIVIPDNAVRDIGNCVDGTLAIRSNKYIINLCFQGSGQVVLGIKNGGSNITNGGFTTMNIAGTNYSRSSATFQNNLATGNRFASWMWTTSSNPFGTTTGATKVVTFT